MTSERLITLAAAAYIAVGIVTFGHGAAHADREHAACEAKPLPPKAIRWCEDTAPINGLGAAVLWPFYWSWEAWS